MRTGLGFVRGSAVPPPVDALLGHKGSYNSPAVTTQSLSITVPASDVTVYLAIGVGTTGTNQTVSSVIWNGISGTKVADTVSVGFHRATIWILSVPPRGTITADINATYSSTSSNNNLGIGAVLLTGLSSTTPTDAKGSNTNNSNTTVSVSLTTTAKSSVVAYTFGGWTTAGAGVITWTGIDKDFDAKEDISSVQHSMGRRIYNTAGAKTISAAPSKTWGAGMVAVSFPLT